MTPSGTDVVGLSDAARAVLADLVSSYAARRAGWGGGGQVEVLDAAVLHPGRPGIVDVIAAEGDRVVHLPLGLRDPTDEARFIPEGEDPVLGLFEDEGGVAVAFDAMRDAEVAVLLLAHVAGEAVEASRVRQVRSDDESVTLAMEDRIAFTVFNTVVEGRRPGLELFLSLDEVGFNHLAAPLAVWRRGGRDLGIVQEYLAGASSGFDLALTSVRDLYASGGPPELAGGDFGAEAHRLGTMTARMHLALDKAFGRRVGEAERWAVDIEATLRAVAPALLERPDVAELLAQLRALAVACQVVRTHGDFHLGRTCRTDQGWYVVDFAHDGRPTTHAGIVPSSGDDDPVYRSPLADVADMMWSFGMVANTAAHERDPSGREGLAQLAHAWEARNRRAFLAGYLGVPGITGLVPAGRDAVRVLIGSFELERTAARVAETGLD
ncbi:MAG TPA: hypothetical protein VN768_05635 [Acidimicrobiales bacterium]|nr:hypothetical protein [Acidimicrobiales bacterium]